MVSALQQVLLSIASFPPKLIFKSVVKTKPQLKGLIDLYHHLYIFPCGFVCGSYLVRPQALDQSAAAHIGRLSTRLEELEVLGLRVTFCAENLA